MAAYPVTLRCTGSNTPPTERTRAYVGLGSNLDDPVGHVRQALVDLAALPETACLGHSRLYRSPPMGPSGQPDYVNAVAVLESGLEPRELLAELQAIEARHGRVRVAERWGPRTLDLDLLVYGNWQSTDPTLTVPHPGIAGRAFVVWPLFEIAPDLEIPGLAPVRRLAEALPAAALEVVG